MENFGKDETQVLFIQNLGHLSRNALFSHFKKYGNILRINVVKDHKTGEGNGTAYLTFDTAAAAKSAIEDGNEAEVIIVILWQGSLF